MSPKIAKKRLDRIGYKFAYRLLIQYTTNVEKLVTAADTGVTTHQEQLAGQS